MNIEIQKAILFQKNLNSSLLNLINTQIDNYDKCNRSLDKLEVKMSKYSCKAFANNKEDLIRYISTSNSMHTPDIELLQIISETFYKITENNDTYNISISIEGIRDYIKKIISLIVESDDIRNYDKLPSEEYRFAKEILKRYLLKKFFKQLNDRGKISVEFEIYEILVCMDIDENNTSYDKFSNLKKFKIDKMMPAIQKALGLEIEVFTVNFGRNTERLYLECVDSIEPKKYARQLKSKYNMNIIHLEKVMKDAIKILSGDKKIKFTVLSDDEYLFNLGEIDFKCIVSKMLNYKVDINVQYYIKDKIYEYIISEDILNEPIIYTKNGEKSLDYVIFIITNYIDEISTIMHGTLIKKELELNIRNDFGYEEKRRKFGPLFTKNGSIMPYEVISMEKNISEEINSNGEHIIKVNVNLEPMLRVNLLKLVSNINENSDEYLKSYDIENPNIILDKGSPNIEFLVFNFNLEKEESYVQIPSIKFIGVTDKEVKKEIEWNSEKSLEEDDILSIKDTEKEFLALNIEKYIHDNLAAMCNNGEVSKYISKKTAENLTKYYEENYYMNVKYEKKYVINYIELID